MNKKGFTLIELLAVIIILAIIALIATPIVLNSIENAQEGAAERTAENYVDAVELAVMEEKLNNPEVINGTYGITEDGNLCAGGTTSCDNPIIIEMNGQKPIGGSIKIENGLVSETPSTTMTVGDYTVSYDEEGNIAASKSDGEPDEHLTAFAKDSWATIQENVKTGNLSKYNVGDTKEVTLTGEVAGTYTLRIANNSTPSECSTSGFSQTACGFVVEFEDIITKRVMNSTDTSVGGWKNSTMRTYLNGTVLESLPNDLEDVIIDTYVVSGYELGAKNHYITTDKLYLLEVNELSSEVGSVETAGHKTRVLDYYKDKITSIDFTAAIKQYDGTNSAWWLRAAYPAYNTSFYVEAGKYLLYSSANNQQGVSPAFRIGKKA